MGNTNLIGKIPGYSTLKQGRLLLQGLIRQQREVIKRELAPIRALRENFFDDTIQLGRTVKNLDRETLKSLDRIKIYAEILRSNNLYISLLSASGEEFSLPTSNVGLITVALSQARLFVRVREIESFLVSLISLFKQAEEEIPRGKLDLVAAMKQFNRGINKLLEQDRERLKAGYMITAVRDNRAIGSNIALANQFREITGMVRNIKTASLAEAAKSLVFTAQRVFPGGNPAFMLYEPGFFIPYGVALRDEYISAAEDKLEKYLGKYKIPVTAKSQNAFVQAFLECEKESKKLIFERDIKKKRFRKICGGFINEQVVGIKARFFEGISFPEGENENLFAILRSEERIIGILAIMKRGHFSREDKDKVDVLIHEAETKLDYIIEREERKEYERKLKISAQEAREAEQEVRTYAEQLKRAQDELVKKERLAAAGEMAADISHASKNSLRNAAALNDKHEKLLLRRKILCKILQKKAGLGFMSADDLSILSRLDMESMGLASALRRELKENDKIVRGMLSFAREENENPERIPLKKFIGEKEKSFRARAEKFGISFYCACGRNIEENDGVFISPLYLSDILNNLIGNAIEELAKISKPEKIVTLKVVRRPDDPDFITFQVIDNGPGISPAQLKTLFSESSKGKSTKKEGYGRGLAESRRKVIKSGGRINVTSEVGTETIFEVKLPRVKAEVLPVAEKKKSVISPALARNIKVVFADDNLTNRELTHQGLTEMGFPVLSFITAEDALKAIQEERAAPDMVITDQDFGNDRMKGHEFIERIISHCRAQKKDLPRFAIFSGGLSGGEAEQTIEALKAQKIKVRWISKGTDTPEFLGEISEMALGNEEKEVESFYPLDYLKTNAFRQCGMGLIHAGNNGLMSLSWLDPPLFNIGEARKGFTKFFEDLKIVLGFTHSIKQYANLKMKKIAELKEFSSNTIMKDKNIVGAWDALPPDQRYKIAIVIQEYYERVSAFAKVIEETLNKEPPDKTEVEAIFELRNKISELKNKISEVNQAFGLKTAEGGEFVQFYTLLELI